MSNKHGEITHKRNSLKKINKTNKTILHDWIEHTKTYLLVTEEKNIQIRCRALESLVNEETTNINARIFTQKDNNKTVTFQYKVTNDKMKEYLSYIHKWKGLSFSAKIPKTEKEYLAKSRNWLNGRRVKMYGDTLFADFIHNATKFAETLAMEYFDQTRKNNVQLSQLYRRVLMCSYLREICSRRISLSKAAKKSYLLNEYAMTAKTKTKQLLQQNSKHSRSTFPSHRREAIDSFQKQYQIEIESIDKVLKFARENKPKSQTDCKFIEKDIIQKLFNGEYVNITSNKYDYVYITPQSLMKIFNFVDNLKKESAKSWHSICELREKIKRLENESRQQSYSNDSAHAATSFISQNSSHNAWDAATANYYQPFQTERYTNGMSEDEDDKIINNYCDSVMETVSPNLSESVYNNYNYYI